MDGGSTDQITLSADEIITAVNEKRFTAISELRQFLSQTISTWPQLEKAPVAELPARVFAHRTATSSKPQGSLALPLEAGYLHQTVHSDSKLTLLSWLPAANRKWMDIIFATLQPEAAVVALTVEGEAVIRELVRLKIEENENTPTTVKYAVSKSLLQHFTQQAHKLRQYEAFREFDNFSELESFLRSHCPFLYCLGVVFTHTHTVLKTNESFLCFSSPLNQQKGVIIARKNKSTRKVEITPEGIACITHSSTSRLHMSNENNVATGSRVIHEVHKKFSRPNDTTDHNVRRFSTIAAAEEYLAKLPALRYVPYERQESCICIKYGKRKLFKLIQSFDGHFVETGELCALLENFFTIAIALDELAALAHLERDPKKTTSKKSIQAQRRNIVDKLIALLTGDPINLATPLQQAWAF